VCASRIALNEGRALDRIHHYSPLASLRIATSMEGREWTSAHAFAVGSRVNEAPRRLD
jgi:hypothetical protein